MPPVTLRRQQRVDSGFLIIKRDIFSVNNDCENIERDSSIIFKCESIINWKQKATYRKQWKRLPSCGPNPLKAISIYNV